MPDYCYVRIAYFYKFFSLLFLIGINNFHYFFYYILSSAKFFYNIKNFFNPLKFSHFVVFPLNLNF